MPHSSEIWPTLLCVWLAVLALLCPARVFATNSTLVIATFGTSLTADGLWQPELQRRLAHCLRRPVTVLNFGRGGTASSWGKANVQSVITAKPDIALIEFAINDAYLPHKISLEESYANMTAIVRAIQHSLPDAKIFLWTTNPTMEPDRPDIARYYRQYRQLADDLGVGLIDLFPTWENTFSKTRWRRLMPDRIHPTIGAYRQIALNPLTRALSSGACE
jgi:acyl-CoA thioesterase I